MEEINLILPNGANHIALKQVNNSQTITAWFFDEQGNHDSSMYMQHDSLKVLADRWNEAFIGKYKVLTYISDGEGWYCE